MSEVARCPQCNYELQYHCEGLGLSEDEMKQPIPCEYCFLKKEVERLSHPFLCPEFLEAMNDIGRYGHEKYGKMSFHHRRANGDHSRDIQRTSTLVIRDHARQHFQSYVEGVKHDHFNTEKHQLAAVAFNAMMEAFFEGMVK
jgi:hypothetical protein